MVAVLAFALILLVIVVGLSLAGLMEIRGVREEGRQRHDELRAALAALRPLPAGPAPNSQPRPVVPIERRLVKVTPPGGDDDGDELTKAYDPQAPRLGAEPLPFDELTGSEDETPPPRTLGFYRPASPPPDSPPPSSPRPRPKRAS